MKISLNWLRDYIDLRDGLGVDDLVAGLVQLGHEVDAVEDAGAALANIVVGKVLERVQHPNADKLGVCQVDVGADHGGVRQIVCGAPNARAGLTVAVALPGAVVHGGKTTIGESEIRGQVSKGMIAGRDELGLESDDPDRHIWEMDTEAAVGTPLAEVLGRNDTVLDVAVTPNRGDCLSHYGLARDMAALGLGTLKPWQAPEIVAKGAVDVEVTVATAACPQFNLMRVRGVANKASPSWVQARLEACGMRPKNILVDVTNYVMLAVGQPLHAYDVRGLDGVFKVRGAKAGEGFESLLGDKLTLRDGDIVIEDGAGKIIDLCGISGGAGSAVQDDTAEVVLEAAVFDRAQIARTGQAHIMTTDARYRFERGIDPASTQEALRLCAALVQAWGGGEVSAMVTAGAGVAAPQAIAYDPALCGAFGGLAVEETRQREILTALGFGVKADTVPWQVVPPAFRTYMANPEDLVEEVLRVVGYEEVPATLPRLMPAQLEIDGRPVELDRVARKALAANGFVEAMTYSFIGHADAVLAVDDAGALLELDNPLAQDSMTTMCPSLLPGLLRAAAGNAAHKDVVAKLGEAGKVFDAKGERLAAAGLLLADGARLWRGTAVKPDVFTAKAAALALLETLGAPVESLVVEAGAGAMYHPGKSGTLRVGPMVLARFGELHPKVLKHFGIKQACAAVEIELQPLLKVQAKARGWQPEAFPAVKRDVALVLPKEVKAADVQATLKGADRTLVRAVDVFDLYEGEHVGVGKKSLALGLTLRADDRTLTEAEINGVVDKALALAKDAYGAELRG